MCGGYYRRKVAEGKKHPLPKGRERTGLIGMEDLLTASLGAYSGPEDMDLDEEQEEASHAAIVEGEEEAEENAPQAGNRRPFRLQARNLYLTYPRCERGHAEVMTRIRERFGDGQIDYVVVGRELHADGSHHLHVALGLKSRVNYRTPACLDWVTGQHGNYQSTRDRVHVLRYCIKDGDYSQHGIVVDDYLRARKKHKGKQSEAVAKEVQDGKSLKEISDAYPGFTLMNLPKIKAYQSFVENTHGGEALDGNVQPILSLSISPVERKLYAWLRSNLHGRPTRPFGKKQMYLHGPTNLGKTSLVMTLMTSFRIYWMPMEENFFDDYHDKRYDLIVADEYSGQKTIQFMNAFVQGAPKVLRIKGGQVMKRKNLPLIILSNYSPAECYRNVFARSPGIVASFARRFKVVELTENIFDLIDRLTPAVEEGDD